MPMWVICRRIEQECRVMPRSRGFTLIEMLVVLLIAGLLTAVVVPAMERMSRGSQLKSEHDTIVGELDGLGYGAFLSGKSVTLSGSVSAVAATYPIKMPEGWQLRVAHPVVFAFNGICGGGEVTLVTPDGVEEKLTLIGPVCRIR